MIEIKSTDLAYLAGLFDGEGCVLISESTYKTQDQRVPRFQLRATITNNCKEVLDWVLSLGFGGFIVNHWCNNKNPVYHFIINDDCALVFLETILPYLKIKQEQAKFAVVFQKRKKKQCKWNRYNPMPYFEVRNRRIFKYLLSSMKTTQRKQIRKSIMHKSNLHMRQNADL